MDDIFVYFVPLPHPAHEIVTPCADGYTVYIADWLDQEHRVAAYEHALTHIRNNDFEKDNVQEIEMVAHGLMEEKPVEPPPKKKRKKVSKYERYVKKLKRLQKAMESLGAYEYAELEDDEYGCPRIAIRYR